MSARPGHALRSPSARSRSDASAHVTLGQSSVSLAAGGSTTISVSLTGTRPAAGDYEGFIDVKGAGPDLHLPYFYVVGDGVPYDIFPHAERQFHGRSQR